MAELNFSLRLPRNGALPFTIAERTRRVYDTVAAVYPASTFFFHSKAHELTLRHSGIQNGMRVLEIATGSGEMFRRLVQANPKGTTFGLDLSPNMAARTQRVRFSCDGCLLPFNHPIRLAEDLAVRDYLKTKLKNAAVSRILIERPAKDARTELLNQRVQEGWKKQDAENAKLNKLPNS